MSIVPSSALSASELSSLGNNVGIPKRRRRPRRVLAAVNRSLAAIGEAVAELRSRQMSMAWGYTAPLRVTRRHRG
jgi:hypothetical protein